jgi:hypothetical protein
MVKALGRKGVLTAFGVVAVVAISLFGKDVGSAAGAVALMVAAFSGANAAIDRAYAVRGPARDVQP